MKSTDFLSLTSSACSSLGVLMRKSAPIQNKCTTLRTIGNKSLISSDKSMVFTLFDTADDADLNFVNKI